MKYFLFDASAVVNLYLPNKKKFKEICSILVAEKLGGNASLFIPSFCIAEVKNVFAKSHYRHKSITSDQFKSYQGTFVSQVKNRKIFYSYDLNRYHNLNFDEILPFEHSIDTEWDRLKIKPGSRQMREVQADLTSQGLSRGLYLSSFDMLIISMGIELKRMHGQEIYIVTNDARLNKVCFTAHKKNPKMFPYSLLLYGAEKSDFSKIFSK